MEGFRTETNVMDDGTRIVAVHGELDMGTAPELARTLDLALEGGAAVVIDLTDCSFLDSSALTVLVAAHNRLNGNGQLSLASPQPHVLKVLQMTRLDKVLGVQPTRAAADRAR
jgi:anti-sigma B factor antagonist